MRKCFSVAVGLASSLLLTGAAMHGVWAEPKAPNCINNYRACVGGAGGVDVDRACKKDYDKCLAENPGKNDGGNPKPGTARTINGAIGTASYGASSKAAAAGLSKATGSASTAVQSAPLTFNPTGATRASVTTINRNISISNRKTQ